MSERCKELNIPDYLHTNNRNPDQEFNSELIYRWFKIQIDRESDWRNDKGVSSSIFAVRNDSCNREKYSRKPDDVLYNTTGDDRDLTKFGICQFNSDVLDGEVHRIEQNNSPRIFELGIEHIPTECMYPHCEIIVKENGSKIDQDGPPKSTRTAIRRILAKKIEIIKDPEF
jgi:hypothetical protein